LKNYPPSCHQSHDKKKMIEIIKQFPLAMLVSVKDDKPLITHLPVIINEETGKLVGHIDLNNPQANLLKDNKEVTLVFKGPDCYISPSVYTTEQLPTWNYLMVHITGKVNKISNLEKAKQTMVAMTVFLQGRLTLSFKSHEFTNILSGFCKLSKNDTNFQKNPKDF